MNKHRMTHYNATFSISDKKKKDQFISLFQLLKASSSQMNVTMGIDEMHIQGMDKSHVCLFDLLLHKDWFQQYAVTNTLQLCFDINTFCSIINTKSEDQQLLFYIDSENTDIAHIQFKNLEEKKSEYDKYFKLPLQEYEYEEMLVPPAEYDVEVALPSKKISDVLSQLSNFGDDLQVKCSEDWIDFITARDSIEMCVRIVIEDNDIASYAIMLDENKTSDVLQFAYSLVYVHKLCITNKLSTNIEFSLSAECPMKIYYDLGNQSSLYFYIAPKMVE